MLQTLKQEVFAVANTTEIVCVWQHQRLVRAPADQSVRGHRMHFARYRGPETPRGRCHAVASHAASSFPMANQSRRVRFLLRCYLASFARSAPASGSATIASLAMLSLREIELHAE